jgi:hypothetical protein
MQNEALLNETHLLLKQIEEDNPKRTVLYKEGMRISDVMEAQDSKN